MQDLKVKLINLVYEINRVTSESWIKLFGFCLALSWIYAASSQCCIPLPFNPVPFTLQSIAFLFCAWLFGKMAVYAYIIYLLQGLVGAPFFAHFGSGPAHLLGPTGGYLIGFLVAMIFMATTRNFMRKSNFMLLCKYWTGSLIVFAFGLLRLACFVPVQKILMIGFYPFFVGDFVIKAIIMLLLATRFKK
ncbi:MAG: BioY protein [candidate division TM6 bacterium GW2011_GWF2_37_49]|nr:MAG: BioY protein [candidate division TM6 bacterium GW2011_GWF2_37_49]